MNLDLAPPLGSVVCVGAHPDDIEIGAAGTLLKLALRHAETTFHFIVLTGGGARTEEAARSAAGLIPDRIRLDAGNFEDGSLPYGDAAAAKNWLVNLMQEPPDLVFAPSLDDRHQDHRFAGELAWQVFRTAPILEYEIPKWEGERLAANLLVSLETELMDRKLRHLGGHFESQHQKNWYDPEVFRGVARLRGLEAGVEYAEGFVARKLVWS